MIYFFNHCSLKTITCTSNIWVSIAYKHTTVSMAWASALRPRQPKRPKRATWPLVLPAWPARRPGPCRPSCPWPRSWVSTRRQPQQPPKRPVRPTAKVHQQPLEENTVGLCQSYFKIADPLTCSSDQITNLESTNPNYFFQTNQFLEFFFLKKSKLSFLILIFMSCLSHKDGHLLFVEYLNPPVSLHLIFEF